MEKNANNTKEQENGQEKEKIGGIFSRTKQIMEIMDESRAKIESLEEVLIEKSNSYEALQCNLFTLKDEQYKRSVYLETYEKMNSIIKEKHRKFLNFAQLIYTLCQEIFKEFNNRQSECKLHQGLIDECLEKFRIKQAEFEFREKEFKQNLEEINKNSLKEEGLENKEYNTISVLKEELESLHRQIDQYMHSNNETEHFLIEKDMVEANKGQKIIESLEIVSKDQISITEKLEELEINNYELVSEQQSQINSFEQQNSHKNVEVEEKNKNIQGLLKELDGIQDQIVCLEDNIKTIEDKMNDYKAQMENLSAEIRINDEKHKSNINSFQEKINENEQFIFQWEQQRHNILEEISLTNSKIEIMDKDNFEISHYINKLKNSLTENLDQQILSIRSDLQNVKMSLQELKKERENKKHELDIKMKQLDKEIQELNSNIKERQKDIEDFENKTAQNEKHKINIWNETQKQNQILSELETQETQLKVEILDKERDRISTPKFIPRKKIRLEPISKRNNWDSDSSMEGVDRTLSMRAERKVKMNLQKENSSNT